MSAICLYFNTPKGCDRGDACIFFHLTKNAHDNLIATRKINTLAYTKVCVNSVIGNNCCVAKCFYIHPSDDVRYKNTVDHRKELMEYNEMLQKKLEEREEYCKVSDELRVMFKEQIKSLEENNVIYRGYIKTLTSNKRKIQSESSTNKKQTKNK